MESFKILLFGISGLSLIFWTAVIGLWHVDMFPRFFSEDSRRESYTPSSNGGSLGESNPNNSLMPTMENTGIIGLFNRGKYSRQSFVIADFSPIEKGYSVNRLYTFMILSLAVMTFTILGYGLHSGFVLPA